MRISTAVNQFGFKAKHSADLCIYALKEAVDKYRRQTSAVLVGFIDASKAFDRVNHQKLFLKLTQRGAPGSITWYSNQSMQVIKSPHPLALVMGSGREVTLSSSL